MTPVWGARVARSGIFNSDLKALHKRYPKIGAVIDRWIDDLRLGYTLPEFLVDPQYPHVYAIRVDYPPLDARGLGLFLVTYHATDPKPPSMREPTRILTINERETPKKPPPIL